MTDLSQLAKRHCADSKPALCFKAFIPLAYGITHREFCYVAAGRHNPSPRFLRRLRGVHIRLFPAEPVRLRLPNHPPILIGRKRTRSAHE